MLTSKSLALYRSRKRQVGQWLRAQGVPHFIPEPLPSDQYADASHPLAVGYAELARRLYDDPAFVRFDGRDAALNSARGAPR